MSLFLNALKTLADRPEPGFPVVGKKNPPNNDTSSASENASAEKSTPTEAEPISPLEADAESKLQSKLPTPKELLSQLLAGRQDETTPESSSTLPTSEEAAEVSGHRTEPWTNLWQEAVANPTPIEVTPDEPDSPEDFALADVREIAELTSSPAVELPVEPTNAESGRAEGPITPSEIDADSAKSNENAPYSQEMKFIFAPWFEAHDQVSDAKHDADQKPEESASEHLEQQTHSESESASAELPPEGEESVVDVAASRATADQAK